MSWLSTRAVLSVTAVPRKNCPSNDAATKGFRNAYIAKYVVNAATIAKLTKTIGGARSRWRESQEARGMGGETMRADIAGRRCGAASAGDREVTTKKPTAHETRGAH